MNVYFVTVLLAIVLFPIVWMLGWFLERLSHASLNVTRKPGSRAWYVLVGPGVALHETSHALGCIFTRTEIVEFKPINVSVEGDRVVLGYVKYYNPKSIVKRTIINLAPVGVSLGLLFFFALGITYLVPDYLGLGGLGGQGVDLLINLIFMKSDPYVFGSLSDPLTLIGTFVYNFFYTFAGLTVINPLFWIVAFLAMTIMLSNAPSDVDIKNALPGLKFIILFDLIWLVVAYFVPMAGWILFGIFELLAVMFALALAFAGVAYGFFIMITIMGRLKTPFNLLPFIGTIATGAILWYLVIGSAALQTVISIVAFVAIALPLMMVKSLRSTA